MPGIDLAVSWDSLWHDRAVVARAVLELQNISPLQAFVAILRNAFVQAFTPRFERALEEEG
ncbi:hypothetical protein GCM10027514_43010 [Azotobacter armeniacus]